MLCACVDFKMRSSTKRPTIFNFARHVRHVKVEDSNGRRCRHLRWTLNTLFAFIYHNGNWLVEKYHQRKLGPISYVARLGRFAVFLFRKRWIASPFPLCFRRLRIPSNDYHIFHFRVCPVDGVFFLARCHFFGDYSGKLSAWWFKF